MKKIVYILVALFMTLFVACTQEESVETLNGDNPQITRGKPRQTNL